MIRKFAGAKVATGASVLPRHRPQCAFCAKRDVQVLVKLWVIEEQETGNRVSTSMTRGACSHACAVEHIERASGKHLDGGPLRPASIAKKTKK